MRTTRAIDEDVLAAARALAAPRKRSVGEITSELARHSLRQSKGVEGGSERNGIPLLPSRAKTALVTLEIVNALRTGL